MNFKCVFCGKDAKLPDRFPDGKVPFYQSKNLCESSKTDSKFLLEIKITESTGYVCPKCVSGCLNRISKSLEQNAGDLCAGVGLGEVREVG